MSNQFLISLYLISCAATWLFLYFYFQFFMGRKRLINKGHTKEYIDFLREDYKKRTLGIAIMFPILLLIATGIVWFFNGRPVNFNQVSFILAIFLILVIPFPIIDYFNSKKKYKEFAIKSKSEIVIDLKHSLLHKFFNPLLEVIFSIVFLLYAFFMVHIPPLVFIHLVLPWILYLMARKSKFVTQPLLRDGYLYSFIVMEINYGLVVYYIIRYGILCNSCGFNEFKFASLILCIALLARMIYYIFSFKRSFHSIS